MCAEWMDGRFPPWQIDYRMEKYDTMGRRHARRTKQNDQSNYHEQNGHGAQSETAAQAAEEKDLRPMDIPETVWAVYQQTFLEFDEKEQRRIVKGCEKQ